MKVLLLPGNVASQLKVTVDGLRGLGVNANGVTKNTNNVIDSRGLIVLNDASQEVGFVKSIFTKIKNHCKILLLICRHDVIHWFSSPYSRLNLDLWLAKILNKKLFVEFWGSDIRDPLLGVSDNIYYKEIVDRGSYEYALVESHVVSEKKQKLFHSFGAKFLIPSVELEQYVIPNYGGNYSNTKSRINSGDYKAIYPSLDNHVPKIVHSPTAPVTKGTKHIDSAVNALKVSGYHFDFQMNSNIPHAECKKRMMECDIFIDQLIAGDYGLSSVEAMMCGKVVICYLKNVVANSLGDCPIVNANPDNIQEVLRNLILDAGLRNSIGIKSREWAMRHHDAEVVCKQLLAIYSGDNVNN